MRSVVEGLALVILKMDSRCLDLSSVSPERAALLKEHTLWAGNRPDSLGGVRKEHFYLHDSIGHACSPRTYAR